MAQLLQTDTIGQKSPLGLHQLVCFRGIVPKRLILLIGILLLSESVAATPTSFSPLGKGNQGGVRIAQQPAATSQDATRAAAERALQEGFQLYQQGTAESLRQAIAKWEEALPLFRAVGDKAGEALTLLGIGRTYSDLGEKQKALEFYNQSLPLRRAVGDKAGEALTLNNIGSIYSDLGEKQKALEFYNQSLPLSRAVGDKAGEALTLNKIGGIYSDLGEKQTALEFYNQSLPLSRAVGDKAGEATTLNNIGLVYSDLGEKQKALEFYNQSLPLFRAVGNKAGEARTLNNIGGVYSDLAEKQKALEFYNQSLPLSRAVGDKVGEANTLNNIGRVYDDLGEKQKALEFLNQSLPLFSAVGDKGGEASTLNNIGGVYSDLGEKQKALEFYNQSLPLRRAVGDRAGEADTLNNIGGVYSNLGEKQKALEFYNQSLPLRRAVGDKAGEAVTLNNIGAVYDALGDKQKALLFLNQSLPLRRAVGDRAGEATTLSNIGAVYDALGEKQKALEFYNQSLPLSRAVGDKAGEARTLFNFASLERNQGNLNAALTQIKVAIEIVEDLRTKIASQQLRASYFATVQDYYKFYIDLLMQLHKTNPSQGYNALALHISERSKARSLVELLAEANVNIRSGTDPQLRDLERNLQQQLNAAEVSRVKLIEGSYKEKQLTLIKQRIDFLITQLDQVQAQIRVKSPAYAAISQPAAFTLTLPEIQQQVLDDNTLLLEYSLGKERSYLWAVTKTGMTSYELPKRADIEAAAKEFRQVLTDANADESEIATTAAKLSQLILAPVANTLGNKRLLVVSDGILQYIPFAALPVPANTQKSVSQPTRQGINSLAHSESPLKRTEKQLVSHSARQGINSLAHSESPLKRTEKQLTADSLVPRLNLGMLSPRLSLASMLPEAEPPTLRSPAEPGNERLKFPVGFNRLQLLAREFIPWRAADTNEQLSNTNPSPLLLVDREVVSLPSASTLAVLRQQVKNRPQTAKTLAVIADPVFNRDDPRFQNVHKQQLPATGSKTDAIRACESLERLEFSGKEADNILALVPGEKRFAALGFDASRANATRADLSGYQIVHFATHGCVNEDHPELSGVALSQFDAAGANTDGFLRLHDIFNLNLGADLVVLSACKTGVGKEVQGEGLIGLTRGFMYAGAKRVVVSLWNVNDAATSQLMQKYYQQMLQNGLNPVQALREAQLEMWRSEQWKAPYYWAAFVVQGEWQD